MVESSDWLPAKTATQQVSTTDLLFFRDESPDSEIRLTSKWLGIWYLHTNGEMITKHKDYEFSDGWSYTDGGLVAAIWEANDESGLVDINGILHDLNVGLGSTSGWQQFIKKSTIVNFTSFLMKCDWFLDPDSQRWVRKYEIPYY